MTVPTVQCHSLQTGRLSVFDVPLLRASLDFTTVIPRSGPLHSSPSHLLKLARRDKVDPSQCARRPLWLLPPSHSNTNHALSLVPLSRPFRCRQGPVFQSRPLPLAVAPPGSKPDICRLFQASVPTILSGGLEALTCDPFASAQHPKNSWRAVISHRPPSDFGSLRRHLYALTSPTAAPSDSRPNR